MSAPTAREIAHARDVLRQNRKARKADRLQFSSRPFPKRQGPKPNRRVVDRGFLAWLHDQECVACRILGPSSGREIEAAHLKLNSAEKGRAKRLGPRPNDAGNTIPLCRGHHREGSPCCDPAQAKFFEILGWSPEVAIDFAEQLHAAYAAGESGSAVVRLFASRRAA